MIIIIGASKGLGKSLTHTFKDKELLLISRSRINTDIDNHHQINCDISKLDLTSLKNDFAEKEIEAIFFTIGTINQKDDFNLSDDEKNEIINTNFLSIVKSCEFFIDNFTFKKSALFCFCSSVSTLQPRSKQVLYCSAKNALNSYSTSLRYYLNIRRKEIRVANLMLGYLDTEMNKDIKTLLPKKNPLEIAMYLSKNLSSLNGTYYLPKYWFIIKIILSLIPEKIKQILFNKLKI